MAPHMICVLPRQTTAGTVRRLRISVPLIECLLDDQKYFRPETLAPPAGDELRALSRPRIGKPDKPPRPPRSAGPYSPPPW